jgi:hypothetical protein
VDQPTSPSTYEQEPAEEEEIEYDDLNYDLQHNEYDYFSVFSCFAEQDPDPTEPKTYFMIFFLLSMLWFGSGSTVLDFVNPYPPC